jgi:hypothetical protein
MRPNETGIRDQAERRAGGPATAADRARALRTFVEAEQAHLLERHRYGSGGGRSHAGAPTSWISS